MLLLLALDWAALHDIVKSNESDFFAEYTALGASLLVFGVLAFAQLRQSHQRNRLKG